MIVLACSIVGLMSGARIATLLVRDRVVSALDMAKIVTGSLAITIFSLVMFTPTNLFRFWFQVEAPFAIGIVGAFLLAKHRDRAVLESLDDLLSRLMMRMKEGRSLSIALELVASEMRATIRLRWIEIARSVSFSPQKSEQSHSCVRTIPPELEKIAHELRRIDHLSRSQITELERWRVRVRTERIFRRRSVQAMAQVRAQSIVLATIFVLLSAFSIVAFGWKAVMGPFQLSTPIFLAGLFIIWRGGRRVKWSV
jgi:hypothetical protein